MNIVLIVADDVTPAHHGCLGGPTPTPELDRFARDGVLFTRAHGVSPLCCPSRYSIFSSRYPGRAASVSRDASLEEPYSVLQNADLQPGDPTLATRLRALGYFTGHVGKWHNNFHHLLEDRWPACLTPEADLDDPAVDAQLRAHHETTCRVVADCAGFEYVQAVHWGNLLARLPKAMRHHNPAWLTQAALRFLDRAAGQNRPFYLHIAHTVPHGPDPVASLGADHRYTYAGRLDAAPDCHPDDSTILPRLAAAGLQTRGATAGINAGMVQIDDQIGAIRRKLDTLGLLEDTLFVYTADHGIHGKGTCYHGGFNMPLVISWPKGIPGGRRVDEAVSHVDLGPTLIELAGTVPPTSSEIDGRSYAGLLRGYATRGPREFTFQEMGVARSVCDRRYHFVALRYPRSVLDALASGRRAELPSLHAYVESHFCDYNLVNKPHYFDADQLFDLEADPFERRNLVHEPAQAERVARMRAALFAITDTLPGPYPRDVPPFMQGAAYRRLAEARRLKAAQGRYHPQGYDQERVYNFNLPDPVPDELPADS